MELRNLAEPSRNLAEPGGTLRNLRNLAEPSRNLRGTSRNLPLEPCGTFAEPSRNLEGNLKGNLKGTLRNRGCSAGCSAASPRNRGVRGPATNSSRKVRTPKASLVGEKHTEWFHKVREGSAEDAEAAGKVPQGSLKISL